LKISHKLFRCREFVSPLDTAEVPVVTFADFVVVTNDTFSMHYVRQPVLEAMLGTFDGLGKLPQHQLGKRSLSVGDSSTK
jgi:hypothetical protein